MRVNQNARSVDIIGIYFFVFLLYVCMLCVLIIIASPRRFNEYTQYSIVKIKKKITLNYPKYVVMGFFKGTLERIRNSRGKRAISVRATEGLLYLCYLIWVGTGLSLVCSLVIRFFSLLRYFCFTPRASRVTIRCFCRVLVSDAHL